jgi:hypothetical protein
VEKLKIQRKKRIDTEISALKHIWMKDSLKWRSLPLFLQIHHLKEQQNLINDKMKEDSVNIKQVKALKQMV